jgi:microcompartment protein CcmL/EutN
VVTARADNNLLAFLETERMRAEEKERIREEKERIRQQERADDRRREDQRFMMMMMLLKPQHPVAPTIPHSTQDSQSSSQYEFDGQDTIEKELIRRTTGV